jgi:hypothetical protein
MQFHLDLVQEEAPAESQHQGNARVQSSHLDSRHELPLNGQGGRPFEAESFEVANRRVPGRVEAFSFVIQIAEFVDVRLKVTVAVFDSGSQGSMRSISCRI